MLDNEPDPDAVKAYEIASDCAFRGAELLDEKRPGWWNEVDLYSLDMQELGLCVLGQLYGSYSRGKEELWGPEYSDAYTGADWIEKIPKVAHFGFTDFEIRVFPYWPALNEAWRVQIEKRREEAAE